MIRRMTRLLIRNLSHILSERVIVYLGKGGCGGRGGSSAREREYLYYLALWVVTRCLIGCFVLHKGHNDDSITWSKFQNQSDDCVMMTMIHLIGALPDEIPIEIHLFIGHSSSCSFLFPSSLTLSFTVNFAVIYLFTDYIMQNILSEQTCECVSRTQNSLFWCVWRSEEDMMVWH